mmetsp:Transcript_11387/g.47667  ORF Transcript_11387/g.47667 Transcript_11387/m.47667 type:complete len:240 (-) Transcript_11387:579-1298(-)
MESPAKKRAPAMRTGGTPLLRTSGVLKNTAMAPRSLITRAKPTATPAAVAVSERAYFLLGVGIGGVVCAKSSSAAQRHTVHVAASAGCSHSISNAASGPSAAYTNAVVNIPITKPPMMSTSVCAPTYSRPKATNATHAPAHMPAVSGPTPSSATASSASDVPRHRPFHECVEGNPYSSITGHEPTWSMATTSLASCQGLGHAKVSLSAFPRASESACAHSAYDAQRQRPIHIAAGSAVA